MTNKWTPRIEVAKQNARLAERQRIKNAEKAKSINRLKRIERDILLLALAIFLLTVSVVLLAAWWTMA